ncbi:MAG TPA: hypothetical protein VGJ45_39040 [Pseudonocardiaceae bacterium]|jgi:hypothetical protein
MTSPGGIAPKVVRGGIITFDQANGSLVQVIPFQYNPDTLSRTLQPQTVADEPGDRLEALRLKGPPHETIKLDAEFDASEALADPDTNSVVAEFGLHPVLAQLEMLIYPTVGQLKNEDDLAGQGMIEIAQVEAPLTVLVLGRNRAMPVRLTEFSVTEDGFDTELNPIRAKVSLSARVLNFDDTGFTGTAGRIYQSYQLHKQQLSAKAPQITAIGAVGLTVVPGGN